MKTTMNRVLNIWMLSAFLFCLLSGPAAFGDCEQSAYWTVKMKKIGLLKDFRNGYRDWYVDENWYDLSFDLKKQTAQAFASFRGLCDGQIAIKIFDYKTHKLLATFDEGGFRLSRY